jgi:hypothetical protein
MHALNWTHQRCFAPVHLFSQSILSLLCVEIKQNLNEAQRNERNADASDVAGAGAATDSRLFFFSSAPLPHARVLSESLPLLRSTGCPARVRWC